MGPSSKKRKEPPPNRTLLDFFSGADAIKRTRVRTSQQLVPGVQQTKVASREIIVVDSDSDDRVHGKENGNRSARLDRRAGVSEDPQSLNSVTSTSTHAEDKDAFGVPSALLRPPNPCVEVSSNGSHTHQQSPTAPKPYSESMFGFSAPLLEEISTSSYFWTLCGVGNSLNPSCTGSQSTERSQTNSVDHKNISTRVNSANDPIVEFPIGEWAVGDDELVTLGVLDNSAAMDEDEGEPSDEQRFCPVCGIDLTGILILVSVPDGYCHTNPLTFAIPCWLGITSSCQSMSRYNDPAK